MRWVAAILITACGVALASDRLEYTPLLEAGRAGYYGLIDSAEFLGTLLREDTAAGGVPTLGSITGEIAAGGDANTALSNITTIPKTIAEYPTLTLMFWCQGGGDSGDTSWDCNGTTFDEISATASYDQKTILQDGAESVGFNGSDSEFNAPNNTVGDMDTSDYIIEVFVETTDVASGIIADKRGAAAAGWYVRMAGGQFHVLNSLAGSSYGRFTSNTFTDGQWAHFMAFMDRNAASADFYVNGVSDNGTEQTPPLSTKATTLTNANTLHLGLYGGGGNAYDKRIAHVALWKCNACLGSSHSTVAARRAAQIWGTPVSNTSATTTIPDVATRASPLTTAQYDATGTDEEWWKVADDGNGTERKAYGASAVTGFTARPAIQNKVLQSDAMGTSWTGVALTSTSSNTATGPDGLATMDGAIGTAVDTQHGWTQAVTTTAASWVLCAVCTAGNKSWAYLSNNTVANATAYFNLGTCAAGTTGAAATAYARSLGNSLCDIGIKFTGTAAANTMGVYAANADGDNDFAGDAATVNVSCGHVRVALGDTCPQDIPTTTAAVTTVADVLRYKGDDGLVENDGTASVSFKALCRNYDNSGTLSLLTLSDGGSAADYITIEVQSDDSAYLVSAATAGDAGSATVAADITDGTQHAFIVQWTGSAMTFCVDGTCDTDAAATAPDDLDQLHVGSAEDGSQQSGCLISDVELRDS